MRRISAPQKIEQLLAQFEILSLFSTKNLSFSLLEYQPGEFLTSPNAKTQRLLFLVSGTVAIRSIRIDGSEYLLTSGDRFSMLGDVEFVTKQLPAFYAQASTVVLALALPLAPYEEALEQDVPFLHFLLRSVTEKLEHASHTESFGGSLEERLLHWMELYCPDGTLTNIGQTAALLHCSTRQLQRVLRHLTEEGTLRRLGKGVYQRQDIRTQNAASDTRR